MLLERLFEFRNRGDVEKPFLSHIEDLRFTIIKVASALVLHTKVCSTRMSPLGNVATVRWPVG